MRSWKEYWDQGERKSLESWVSLPPWNSSMRPNLINFHHPTHFKSSSPPPHSKNFSEREQLVESPTLLVLFHHPFHLSSRPHSTQLPPQIPRYQDSEPPLRRKRKTLIIIKGRQGGGDWVGGVFRWYITRLNRNTSWLDLPCAFWWYQMNSFQGLKDDRVDYVLEAIQLRANGKAGGREGRRRVSQNSQRGRQDSQLSWIANLMKRLEPCKVDVRLLTWLSSNTW